MLSKKKQKSRLTYENWIVKKQKMHGEEAITQAILLRLQATLLHPQAILPRRAILLRRAILPRRATPPLRATPRALRTTPPTQATQIQSIMIMKIQNRRTFFSARKTSKRELGFFGCFSEH